jgi:hypothetical protein
VDKVAVKSNADEAYGDDFFQKSKRRFIVTTVFASKQQYLSLDITGFKM